MTFRGRIALVGLICCAAATASAQRTIYVNGTTGDDTWDGLCQEWDGGTCGPKEHIQVGINTADAGDTVVVADGTYTGGGNKNLDFGGKAITVRSESGPETCIIDCENDGRGSYFHSGEGPDSILDGFTIRNGSTEYDEYGGGIKCYPVSSPTITNCTISGNLAERGGGIFCGWASKPTITNCTISHNSAYKFGGGVYCVSSSDATITNCTISQNSADCGGGVCCRNAANPTITNCIIWGNTPEAVYVDSCNPVVTYCDVRGSWPGEGNIDADPRLAFETDGRLLAGSPCIDAGTDTPFGGLPLNDLDGNPRPLDGDGDASAVTDMGAFEFNPDAPSIALSPNDLTFHGPQDGLNPGDQVFSIRNCGGTTLNWQVVEDCSWLNISPASGQSAGEVGDVTLSVDNSGMAWGEYHCVVEVSDAAAVNSPRRVVVTLYVNRTLHVPAEYATIQEAIDASLDLGDIVLIADGTYTGLGNKDLVCNGRAITVRSENGPDTCIIDCEYNGRGFLFECSEGPDSVVEGLTIMHGVVAGSDGGGGGVYCTDVSSPTIRDCTITGCSTFRGGGVSCQYLGNPTLSNCLISGNSANSGGGVYCYRSSPTITNCTINQNSANNGGGIHCNAGDAVITNCTITGNSASDDGGGVYCYYSNATIVNCTISRNAGRDDSGGGLYCDRSSPAIRNCTITENAARAAGGGIYCYRNSSATIINCTISENSASEDGGGVYCSSSDPTITNCILWSDAPEEIYVHSGSLVVTYCDVEGGWEGEENIDADPVFVDPDGPDDPSTWEDNDYRLSAGSPCIDAGNNDALPPDTADLDGDGDTAEPIPYDADGLLRVWDGDGDDIARVDMGAYEHGSFTPGDLNCDGVLNALDVDPFVLALANPELYGLEHPDCDRTLADMNGDGLVNAFDIDAFVALLTGG